MCGLTLGGGALSKLLPSSKTAGLMVLTMESINLISSSFRETLDSSDKVKICSTSGALFSQAKPCM